MKHLLAAIAPVALLLGGPTWAASISDIKGEVLVNQGDGLKVVTQPMILNTGDTVIANPGGSAKVICDSGAQIVVEPGKIVTVADCDLAAAGGAGAFGEAGYLLGGVAIAGGVALAIGLSSDSDGPASP